MNFPNEQSKKGIYIVLWFDCKIAKTQKWHCYAGKNLSKSFKFTRPTWFSFIRAIWISSNHSAMWWIITFLALEHEYLKIWESISKMLKPYCEVLTQAPSTNKPANQWLKCSSLWQNLGPKTTWIETNFSALSLSPEHLPVFPPHFLLNCSLLGPQGGWGICIPDCRYWIHRVGEQSIRAFTYAF